jgi:putative tricarboxylic transport membrane protein
MGPTPALGLPNSATTAIVLGALPIHGLRQGPPIFAGTPTRLYTRVLAMLPGNVAFRFLGPVGTELFARITLIPVTFLWPTVVILVGVDAYALEPSLPDVRIMVIAAVRSFARQRDGFSAAPIIVGLIPGWVVEGSLKQSLIVFDHSWWGFFERPIVLVVFALAAVSIAAPFVGRALARRRGDAASAA